MLVGEMLQAGPRQQAHLARPRSAWLSWRLPAQSRRSAWRRGWSSQLHRAQPAHMEAGTQKHLQAQDLQASPGMISGTMAAQRDQRLHDSW